ncbi:HTH-like domain-containing protein [Albimonas pacifica]|uniref:HTH-like domain-containing protein n=1 Tax=Albimonas pacifica TaxID=1114924 RepID=A0A1I3IVY3_9RHOB|nr:HTH-like domain-containing protein [Albimonas pacifica]
MPPISPPTCHDHLARRAEPSRRSKRARREDALRPEIRRVFEATSGVCGTRKVWRPLRRNGFGAARRTVARLTKDLGLQGVIGGKPLGSTVPDQSAPIPLDRVNRQVRVPAPNMLRASDFACVAAWQGFVPVAFVIDAVARRIAGRRVSCTAQASFVLDAREQAVRQRQPGAGWPAARTGVRDACPVATPTAWQRQEKSLRSAASATLATKPGPRPSTACSNRKSSTVAGHGAISRRLNPPPSRGSTGSATVACWISSATCRPRKPKPQSTPGWKPATRLRRARPSASGRPGAVQGLDVGHAPTRRPVQLQRSGSSPRRTSRWMPARDRRDRRADDDLRDHRLAARWRRRAGGAPRAPERVRLQP